MRGFKMGVSWPFFFSLYESQIFLHATYSSSSANSTSRTERFRKCASSITLLCHLKGPFVLFRIRNSAFLSGRPPPTPPKVRKGQNRLCKHCIYTRVFVSGYDVIWQGVFASHPSPNTMSYAMIISFRNKASFYIYDDEENTIFVRTSQSPSHLSHPAS